MKEENPIEQLADGKTLCGAGAVADLKMMPKEGWRFTRLHLERGEIENAKV